MRGPTGRCKRKLVTAEHVHGKTGLDGVELFEPARPLEQAACRRFHHRDAAQRTGRHSHALPARPAHQHRHGIERAPDIAERIEEIVLMGGGYFEGGNITPAAEFNIYVDPEAAEDRLWRRRPDHHDAA
jgi:purine nucleosidase